MLKNFLQLLSLYYVTFYYYIIFQLLDLSRNNINGFDEIQVVKLQQIKDVKLEKNPLICDRCHMGMLIDIARTVCVYKLSQRYVLIFRRNDDNNIEPFSDFEFRV